MAQLQTVPMASTRTQLPVAPVRPVTKHLQQHAQVINCHGCGKRVFPPERVPAGGQSYHKRCIRCCVCGVGLTGIHFSWIAHEGSLFCSSDVPIRPMRVRPARTTAWATPILFDKLSGMSDIVVYIIQLMQPRFTSFVEQKSYIERYVAWGKQLLTLKLASKYFCTALQKWEGMGVADYVAYTVANERGASHLLNGRASGWVHVLASGELDRWEFAEARRLHEANNELAIATRYGGRIPIIDHDIQKRPAVYCFSGDGLVGMASGDTKRVADIAPGDVVRTQHGSQVVKHVFREALMGPRPLVRISDFYITRRHPVFADGIWRMPLEIGTLVQGAVVEAIYNFELAAGEASDDHAVWINGLLVCTLGKGGLPTTKEQDAIYGSGYWKKSKA